MLQSTVLALGLACAQLGQLAAATSAASSRQAPVAVPASAGTVTIKGEVIEVPEVPVVAPSWNFSFASTQAHCLAARWPSSSLALVLVLVPVGPHVLCYTKSVACHAW